MIGTAKNIWGINIMKNQFGQTLGAAVDNWVTRQTPQQINLQGQYCLLEPMNIDKHANDLYLALTSNNEGESWTYLPYGPFASLVEFQTWLQKTMLDTTTQLYAILNTKTKQVVGISGYLRITPEHGVIEIGHLHFSSLLKRTPMATEAIYLMLKFVFDELGYRRCEWKCNALNEASHLAALRFGFKFEGIFRQHFVFKNHNRDTAWFSIIDNEWPPLKMKYKKWLAANNFNSDGIQIKKLAEIV